MQTGVGARNGSAQDIGWHSPWWQSHPSGARRTLSHRGAVGRKEDAIQKGRAYITFQQRHFGATPGVKTMTKTTTHIAAFIAAAVMTMATPRRSAAWAAR